MTAHLSMACECGRSASVPCPTVADIAASLGQFEGWGHDERGFVRCPECIAAGVVIERAPAAKDQLGLFETRAVA